MLHLSKILQNLIEDTLESGCIRIGMCSILEVKFHSVHNCLSAAVRESDYGLSIIEEFLSNPDSICFSSISQFNKHVDIICGALSKLYYSLVELKPLLWDQYPHLFEQLLFAFDRKAIWTYFANGRTFYPFINLIPNSLVSWDRLGLPLFRQLLTIKLSDEGDYYFGLELKKRLEDMSSKHKHPFILSENVKFNSRESDKHPELNEILTMTFVEPPIPLDKRISHRIIDFVSERKQAVDTLRHADDCLGEHLESISQSKQIVSSEIKKKLISKAYQKISSNIQIHLRISDESEYMQVSLSAGGRVCGEHGATINTRPVIEAINRIQNVIDNRIVDKLEPEGRNLFKVVFEANSWAGKFDNIGLKYVGIDKLYREIERIQKDLAASASLSVEFISRRGRGNPMIHELPVETLFDGSEYLCLKYPIYRYPYGLRVCPSPSFYPFIQNALLIGANPNVKIGDISDVDTEIEYVSQSLTQSGVNVTLVKSNEASADRILEEINKDKYQVIHFAGHAFFNENEPDLSYLLVGKRESHAEELHARSLRLHVCNCRPWLVYLNGCKTQRFSSLRPVTGLCDAFIQLDVPVVMGMSGSIRSDLAVELAITFYSRILQGDLAEEALRKARLNIVQKSKWKTIDWALPVLVKHPFVS